MILSSIAWTLWSWVRIPHRAWMFGVYMCLLCVCAVLCLGRGLAMSWSLVLGVLPIVNGSGNGKAARANKGCRAIKIKWHWGNISLSTSALPGKPHYRNCFILVRHPIARRYVERERENQSSNMDEIQADSKLLSGCCLNTIETPIIIQNHPVFLMCLLQNWVCDHSKA
jgi:hypothetical protein